MLSEELRKKLSAIPEEAPNAEDLQMLHSAKGENAGGDGMDMEEYFAQRKTRAISLRLPRSLHEQLQINADLEGVSLNQYCMYLLTAGVSASGR